MRGSGGCGSVVEGIFRDGLAAELRKGDTKKKLRKRAIVGRIWDRTFDFEFRQPAVHKRASMALFRVKPTVADIAIAKSIAAHTRRPAEHIAQTLTWGGDEHVLCALAIGWWFYARTRNVSVRRASDHVLAAAIVASLLPHALKKVFNQVRPDRLTVLGHLHGIPVSGNRLDAFPSGHAVHIGALASAATALPPAKRNAVWAVGSGLVLTRIVLLAHWTSDVLAGLAIGAAAERLLRFATGFGRR